MSPGTEVWLVQQSCAGSKPQAAVTGDRGGSGVRVRGCQRHHAGAAVCEGAGGGRLHADRGSASYLLSMPPDAQAALRGIREALKGAKRLVARALPSVQRLLAEDARSVGDGERMQIDDAVKNIICVLSRYPVA
jgi:hypothetical protein